MFKITLQLVAYLITIFYATISYANAPVHTIAFNQFVNHVALDAAQNGVHHALKKRNITPNGAMIISANAQGNITNSVQIARQQVASGSDVIVAIATPSAQATLSSLMSMPNSSPDEKNKKTLAFIAVTDPAAAGLTKKNDDKNFRIIGVSDEPDIKTLMEVTLRVLPGTKTVGVIFNPGEINSVHMVDMLSRELSRLSLRINKVAVNNSSDIRFAMQKLIGNVDVLYLPQDNTVVSALDMITKVARDGKLMLIASDPSLVERGVFLAYGTDYYNNGVILGNMIADILENKFSGDNIRSGKKMSLAINQEIAGEEAIFIPDDIAKEADFSMDHSD
jgi:putative ABC transport system substrate-binding protein